MLGSESVPVASAASQEEAAKIQQRIFEALKSGEAGLDLVESEKKD